MCRVDEEHNVVPINRTDATFLTGVLSEPKSLADEDRELLTKFAPRTLTLFGHSGLSEAL